MTEIWSCRDCGAEWTGHNPCHCTGCHETFSSESSFDKHQRIDRAGHATCLDPRTATREVAGGLIFTLSKRGYWSSSARLRGS